MTSVDYLVSGAEISSIVCFGSAFITKIKYNLFKSACVGIVGSMSSL